MCVCVCGGGGGGGGREGDMHVHGELGSLKVFIFKLKSAVYLSSAL